MAGTLGTTVSHHWRDAEEITAEYFEHAHGKWVRLDAQGDGDFACATFFVHSPEQAERLASSILEAVAEFRAAHPTS